MKWQIELEDDQPGLHVAGVRPRDVGSAASPAIGVHQQGRTNRTHVHCGRFYVPDTGIAIAHRTDCPADCLTGGLVLDLIEDNLEFGFFRRLCRLLRHPALSMFTVNA